MPSETHTLKSWTTFFKDIITGKRTSDIRTTVDRRFMAGDILALREWDPVKNEYTGREASVEVTYVQNSLSNPCAISHLALHEDYVVLSIRLIELDI